MILCKEEHAKAINSAVFPGQQGGPLEHVIAGKAVAFRIAQTELFRERQRRTVAGAKASVEAAALNDAYRTLKDPLSRAVYLAELRGVELPGDGRAAGVDGAVAGSRALAGGEHGRVFEQQQHVLDGYDRNCG